MSERQPKIEMLPELYLQFARKLNPGHILLTFNYDTILELALQSVGKPFRLFPTRYKRLYPDGGGVADHDTDEVTVLKLHGSIDWFDKYEYNSKVEQWRGSGIAIMPDDGVFNSSNDWSLTRLLDGLVSRDDPLIEIYRLQAIDQFYISPPFFLSTPSLILPSTSKILFAHQFRDFWHGLGQGELLNFRMAIIGYSLPEHDDYARQVIFRLVRNYQENYWDKDVLGKRKDPLRLVDYRQTEEQRAEFYKRYSFVIQDRSEIYLQGLNADVVDQLMRP